jgi:microsomal dipeptidase-like Zn-dependent dipeptidase
MGSFIHDRLRRLLSGKKMPTHGDIDIHCHPPIKAFLFDEDLHEDHWTVEGFYPFEVQVDAPKMIDGDVTAILSAVYIPEIGMRRYCPTLEMVYGAIREFWKAFKEKVETDSPPEKPFMQTMQILDLVEHKVDKARKKGFDVAVAKTRAEFESRLASKKLTLVHAIEGAHHLGRGLSGPNEYINHVDALFNRGVCYMTLGHFFDNDVVASANAFPPNIFKLSGCNFEFQDKQLGVIGTAVVNRMLDLGMIVDLTHTCKMQRDTIFNLNNARGINKRPLIFSHVGVSALFQTPPGSPASHLSAKTLLPTDDELLKIRDCGGVIGIITVNYWLCGIEIEPKPANGLQLVLQTVDHIKSVTGSYDNISIGSDYDGFTDPSDDLQDISYIRLIRDGLSAHGLSVIEVEKIMSGNFRRVLANGWGR